MKILESVPEGYVEVFSSAERKYPNAPEYDRPSAGYYVSGSDLDSFKAGISESAQALRDGTWTPKNRNRVEVVKVIRKPVEYEAQNESDTGSDIGLSSYERNERTSEYTLPSIPSNGYSAGIPTAFWMCAAAVLGATLVIYFVSVAAGAL